MPLFETSTVLQCPADRVFDFLTRPTRVLEILPDDSGVTYTNVPEQLSLGSRVEFDLRGFGPVQRVIHEVTEFNAIIQFVESQLQGPLPHWRHEHLFEANGANQVKVIDRIDFAPPGGLAGLLVTESRIRKSLETGFAHRHRRLKELLENGGF